MAVLQFAEMFGRMLDKEFADNGIPNGTDLDLHWLPLGTSLSWTTILVHKFLTQFWFNFLLYFFHPVLMGH